MFFHLGAPFFRWNLFSRLLFAPPFLSLLLLSGFPLLSDVEGLPLERDRCCLSLEPVVLTGLAAFEV